MVLLYLGLTQHCLKCKLSFLNTNSYGIHVRIIHSKIESYSLKRIKLAHRTLRTKKSAPPRPWWMTKNGYDRCTSIGPYDSIATCLGCSKDFKAKTEINGTLRPHFDYFVHCIEHCEAYKDLNFIRECEECEKKFMNGRSYSSHKRSFHSRDNHIVNIDLSRDTMKSVNEVDHIDTVLMDDFEPNYPSKRRSSNAFTFDVNCKGCQKRFKTTEKCQLEDDYYTHCIKECREYKKLGMLIR